jgi:multiple antibiotic resistance protein
MRELKEYERKSPFYMLKLSSIFILFFITLGPIKTLVPFVQLTSDADTAFCRMVALRASLTSTAIVVSVAVFGPLILINWGVSFDAVALTGGIILFLLPLQIIMPSPKLAEQGRAEPEKLSTSTLISRLVIPTIVTPPGIAAILALAVLSVGNLQLWLTIIVLLLLVMLLNLLIMLSARKLVAFLTVAGLHVIGWIFAVLQASIGIQVIINSLRRLKALPM